MPSNKPRIYVTLEPEDYEILQIISRKDQVSMSSLIRKSVREWIEKNQFRKLKNR